MPVTECIPKRIQEVLRSGQTMFHSLLQRWGELGFKSPDVVAIPFDIVYTVARYTHTYGRLPNLISPRTFSEHLNHKKLFDRRPILTQLADKYAVRRYVAERVGAEFLPDLYLVTQNPDQIQLSALPERFVIKATHGSGWSIIVTDKSTADEEAIRCRCATWLKKNYYELKREWCYKDIQPRIIVEAFLGDSDGRVPVDYKLFCFDGSAKLIQVDIGRFESQRRYFYDLQWHRVDVKLTHTPGEGQLRRPDNLEQIIQTAESLADGLDFVRVDLYSVQQQVYFGEMTNYPGRGFSPFEPSEWDAILGSFWASER